MVFRHLIQNLLITIVIVVTAMVLRGAVGTQELFELVLLLMVARGWTLVRQWRYKPPTEQEWQNISAEVAHRLLPQAPVPAVGENPPSLDAVLDSPAYQHRMEVLRKKARPRDHRDIVSEAVNLVLVLPASILVGLMLSSHIVTLEGMSRWIAVGSVAGGLALHFGVELIRAEKISMRITCRAILAMAMLSGALVLACVKHPYLLTFGEARHRKLADLIMALQPSVEALRHADALFAYGRDLETDGNLAEAALWYQRGLEMSPRDGDAHQHLASIFGKMGREADAEHELRMASYIAPVPGRLRVARADVHPLPVLQPRYHLPFTICLVPVGDVPQGVLDWMGREIEARVNVPVVRFSHAIKLPPHGRKNGLLGGEQWRPEDLWTAFALDVKTLPVLPIQYVLVTSVDLYTLGSNFVFAAGFNVNACVSYARFHDQPDAEADNDPVLIDRLVKNTLSCSIKALGVPGSTEPDCVTAYSKNLDELDLKAPVPSPETDKLYRQAIVAYEQKQWTYHP